jgi:hypothetical protein
MCEVGDIVKIFAPQAGHKKYHLCICVADENNAAKFLYLNSDPTYDGTYIVECERVPCIPPSDTGKTAFTFAIIVRYTDRQRRLYQAEVLGRLDKVLAAELYEFASSVRTLNARDRAMVLQALAARLIALSQGALA